VEPDPTIVQFPTRMLNDFNPLVQKFSMDQQRLFSPHTAKVAIQLDGLDGILYNLLYAHCYVHTFNTIIYATFVQPINIVFRFLIFRMHFASRKSSGLGRPFDVCVCSLYWSFL
jgi:hypothetical protein